MVAELIELEQRQVSLTINIDTCNERSTQRTKRFRIRDRQSNFVQKLLLPTNEERTAVCCLSSVNLEHFDEWKKMKSL